jgi:hypothetical protein
LCRTFVLLAFVGVPTAAAIAQIATVAEPAEQRELLNSERIEREFGSYGVDVLESDDRVRVSSLFSREGARRICRTFAVVRYPDAVAPAFAAEHAEILAGGSIGAVFAARGWRVRKTHLHYGEVTASPRLADLMSIAARTTLALHVYVLTIVKPGAELDYASIVEIHHPEYLRREELAEIYGAADSKRHEALLAAMLATADAKIGR